MHVAKTLITAVQHITRRNGETLRQAFLLHIAIIITQALWLVKKASFTSKLNIDLERFTQLALLFIACRCAAAI